MAHPSLAGREFAALQRFAARGLPLYCGGGRRPQVALTFDDGPGIYSAKAVHVLRHVRARATFFLVGKELDRWPGLPRLEQSVGVLGDHSWTHPLLTRGTRAQVAQELGRTRAAIDALSGTVVRLFRPPYGATNDSIGKEAAALGMVQVLWSVDSGDSWPGATAERIAARVKRYLRAGAIVLMHENRGQTLKALRYQILPLLQRRHLRAVTLPYMLATDPPTSRQSRQGLGACGTGSGGGPPSWLRSVGGRRR